MGVELVIRRLPGLRHVCNDLILTAVSLRVISKLWLTFHFTHENNIKQGRHLGGADGHLPPSDF